MIIENVSVGDIVILNDKLRNRKNLVGQRVEVTKIVLGLIHGVVESTGEEIIINPVTANPITIAKPNEIWKTNVGNYVLIVEHPMTEVEGNLGFIWFDTVDNTLNFSPLRDQLVEKVKMSVGEWGGVMGDLTDPERNMGANPTV